MTSVSFNTKSWYVFFGISYVVTCIPTDQWSDTFQDNHCKLEYKCPNSKWQNQKSSIFISLLCLEVCRIIMQSDYYMNIYLFNVFRSLSSDYYMNIHLFNVFRSLSSDYYMNIHLFTVFRSLSDYHAVRLLHEYSFVQRVQKTVGLSCSQTIT